MALRQEQEIIEVRAVPGLGGLSARELAAVLLSWRPVDVGVGADLLDPPLSLGGALIQEGCALVTGCGGSRAELRPGHLVPTGLENSAHVHVTAISAMRVIALDEPARRAVLAQSAVAQAMHRLLLRHEARSS